MSGRYPGGADTPDLLWDVLKSGVDAVGEAQGDRWDLGWHHPDPSRQWRVYTRAGGYLSQIDGFDAEFFGMSAREARQVDPQQRLLLELAWEALEDASHAPRGLAGSDTGVFVGISSNDYAALLGRGAPDAYSNTGSSFSIAANRISYVYDFHGPSVALDTACSSSIVCIHQACRSILAGECTMALAGGVSLLTHIRPWIGFARASMLSPTGRCKSFDASGDGYVRSEGGGLVVLKSLADAERDGDRILGVILASGVNSDGRTLGLSMPNDEAQEQLLRKIYTTCGVSPEDVVYVEAHGTGTAVGDPLECAALGRVLGAPRTDGSRLLIGSVKSNIGHLEAASGIAGLTKVLLALKHHEIPGNLHFETPNPKIDFENWKLDVVVGSKTLSVTEKPAVVGINSFGFGGTNAHLALQEYRPVGIPAADSRPASEWGRVLILSGHTEAALEAVARRHADFLRHAPAETWGDICAAAALCRTPLRYRMAVSAATPDEAADRLEQFLEGRQPARLATGSVTTETVPIAFVYSGNGPQWWGMGRELLASSEEFRREIEAMDAVFAPLAGWSILEEMRRPEAEARVALTEYAQPLLFALQLGLTALLRAAQIRPSAVLGHSVGEAAAAYACGALTREQATRVIYHRSMAQSKTAGMGGMAAFGISAEEAREALQSVPGWLELAASNGPNAVTVAGDPEALEALRQKLTEDGKFARVLPLNYPFHTTAMDGIRAELVEALDGLTPHESEIPFISTVDAGELPGTSLGAEYWWRNVREPVQFHEAVDLLLNERGVAVFIEIGPHPVLRDYIQQSARVRDLNVVALQTLRRPGAKGPEMEEDNLWTALCACHAAGASTMNALFERPRQIIPELPLYPWQRERHWRGGVTLPEAHYPTERDHPLLGYRVPSADGLWEVSLSSSSLPYLTDHIVQGAAVFPAAGYIEQALTAARLTLGEGVLDLENFEILRPLVIPEHEEPIVQFAVDAKDGTFEIRALIDKYEANWTTHTRGRLSKGDNTGQGAATDLEALAATLPLRIDAEEHYADTDRRGLSYGPAFQGVHRIHLSLPDADRREAFAEICLPSSNDFDLTAYQSHPTLLDSCLQVLVALIGQNERPTVSAIPVHVERIRSFKPLPAQLFCHVEMRRESDRSAVADFRLMDGEGELVLTLAAARCQKVDFRQAASAPLITEWWRPDPAHASRSSAGLPTPSATVAAIMPEVERITLESDRAEFYRDILPRFDRLLAAYAVNALDTLWSTNAEFDLPRLARRGRVQRDQERLLARLVEIAEQDGRLAKGNRGWLWDRSRVPETPERLWRDLFYDFPRYQTELLLIARAGDRLVDVLQGETPPLLSAEGDNSGGALDSLSDTAPFQTSYNQIVRAALLNLIESWPVGRPIRILEIGGGSGGLAATLLPVLPPDRTDYLFTDLTEAALGRTGQRFRGYRFVRLAALDIESDPIAQGQPSGYFDIIIAANALHTAGSLRTVLAHVRSLMAPGGQLIAVEAHDQRLTDLVFGQDPAWWDAADTDARPGSRLLSADAWKGVLSDAGFEDPTAISDRTDNPQQSVLLATSPALPCAAESVDREISTRRWLILTDVDEASSPFVRTLMDALTAQGQDVHLHCMVGDDTPADSLRRIAAESPIDEIVQLTGLTTCSVDDHPLLSQQWLRCLSTLQLVQSLETAALEHAPLLALVTRGAMATANGDGPLDPGQAPLWGLGRVISSEQPALKCRLIDLHADLANPDAPVRLAEELLRRGDETEVQLTAGQRFVNRERLTTLSEEARMALSVSSDPTPFILDFHAQGGLDSLYLRAVERHQPGQGEVEIRVRAAGLNFRDVLWAMGMLPEEAVEHGFSGPTIGMECAGEVVRVGADVDGIEAGDRVIAFASSCFASYVTTSAGSVALIPEGIGFDEAATIPTAFLTAYYALEHLARLVPGERVLIHGAAGGVGLAAVQIAKLKGAVVFGTAGSVGKRRALTMLGVDHVLSSRSLDFADEIMRLTDGVGVDVVLNSLAGEAITKSLQVLRPFGRFLEIGKRDLYANSRIGLRPFRNNLSYFGIDADTLLIERPDLARANFQAVVELFRSGALRPLPFQSIPVSRASEAFRAMQQSKHIGKLVITMQDDLPSALPIVRTRPPVRSDATYLVTGGLGGFGLSTAQWLVAQGARSLALVGRRGATTEEALEGIAQMESAGATVRPFAADIADADALARVLDVIRSEMPPLRGVIHSAAVIEDALIANLSAEVLDRVLAPKALGAWNLHRATLEDPLDMFVLYSSSSVVVGNPGQGAYVAANMYLESLAQYRRAQGLPGLAIGWGAIKDAGFLTRHANVAEMLKSRSGLDATPVSEALPELGRLCAVGALRVCVARFNLQRLGQAMAGARVPKFQDLIPQDTTSDMESGENFADTIKATPEADRRALVLARIRDHAGRVLGGGAGQVDVERPLAEMGLDSLMAVELAAAIERDLGQPVSVMQMLSAGNISAIADLVLKIVGFGSDSAT
jgi:phthiocerol/phenolphthiocerol synthesis type-I polyketide synthase C